MQPIRVLQWGLGAMGGGMARLMLEKPGLAIVAAVDGRPDYVGQDLGQVLGVGKTLGVTVTNKPEEVLNREKVDLVVLAMYAFVLAIAIVSRRAAAEEANEHPTDEQEQERHET